MGSAKPSALSASPLLPLELQPSEPAPAKVDEVRDAFEAFNVVAPNLGLSVAIKLTDSRRSKLAARLNDHGAAGWTKALAKLSASRFCKGGNQRGWKADFDFLLQPDSLTRLIEGGYDDRPVSGAKLNGAAKPKPANPTYGTLESIRSDERLGIISPEEADVRRARLTKRKAEAEPKAEAGPKP